MRTLAEHEDITISLLVTALYQYDDVTPDEPHHYEWRGIVASGETKFAAKVNLAARVTGRC